MSQPLYCDTTFFGNLMYFMGVTINASNYR